MEIKRLPRSKIPIIRHFYAHIYYYKSNCLVGMTGKVGMGKSHTCVYLARQWDPKFTLEQSLVYSVDELLEKTFSYMNYKGKPFTMKLIESIQDWKEWLKENHQDVVPTKGRVIIFDEVANAAHVRDFWSKSNKSLAKIIMIWRFLRMLVFFVVPERMNFADSTISQFLDFEIKVTYKDPGKCVWIIMWSYEGWDEVKRSPRKKRIPECSGHGHVKIPPLPKKLADQYEEISKYYKLSDLGGILSEMKRDAEKGKSNLDMAKQISEIMLKEEKYPLDAFRNRRGTIDAHLIMSTFNVNRNVAYNIKSIVEKGTYLDM